MPLANSLIVNQKLVFARIEIAAARKIQLAGQLDPSAALQDNPIENKLHQHAHLDSAVNQLASAFKYFLLELGEDSQGVDCDILKQGLVKASPWLAALLATSENPEFIALQFASDTDAEDSTIETKNSPLDLIASVTLTSPEEVSPPPIDLLAEWSRLLQAIVDRHRASLFEE